MTSSAEAIRQMRLYMVDCLRNARTPSDVAEARLILFDIKHVTDYGVDGLIELKLRRMQRRAAQRAATRGGSQFP